MKKKAGKKKIRKTVGKKTKKEKRKCEIGKEKKEK